MKKSLILRKPLSKELFSLFFFSSLSRSSSSAISGESFFLFFLLSEFFFSELLVLRCQDDTVPGCLVRVSLCSLRTVCGSGSLSVVEEVIVDFFASAVHVTLCEYAEDGVHRSIVVVDLWILGLHRLCDELGEANLRDVGMLLEYLVSVRHVASTACEDDAAQ